MDVDQATDDASVTGPKMTPEEVLITTHEEILTELQSKYTGLHNLSKKTGHKLLALISETIFERLKTIMEQKPEESDTCFKLSKGYRKIHPHFGDFQMILSTLHKIQDASGVPRSQLSEQDFTTHNMLPCFVDDIPLGKMQQASNKYYKRVITTILEHFKSVDRKTDAYTEEDVARIKVRTEMKKMAPYMPMLVKQAISKHFMPATKSRYQRIRIYGEPFLPNKKRMMLFVKRYASTFKLIRSENMFNLLQISVPLSQCASLATVDGTVVGGAKLVIRSSSDTPLYTIPETLISEMKSVFHPSREALSSRDINNSRVEETHNAQVLQSKQENFIDPHSRDNTENSTIARTNGDLKKKLSNKPLELETDPVVLKRRQKQIDYGKNTVGYYAYTQQIPLEQRTKKHPKTPEKYARYSRRSWDALIKIWRKQLHAYDPSPKAEPSSEESADEAFGELPYLPCKEEVDP